MLYGKMLYGAVRYGTVRFGSLVVLVPSLGTSRGGCVVLVYNNV